MVAVICPTPPNRPPVLSNNGGDPDSLVIDQDKQLVFENWPVDQTAGLVLVKRRNRPNGGIEKVFGVEIAVANVLIKRTVEFVGSRFRHGGENATNRCGRIPSLNGAATTFNSAMASRPRR